MTLKEEALGRIELWDNHERFRVVKGEDAGPPLEVRLSLALIRASRILQQCNPDESWLHKIIDEFQTSIGEEQ